MARIVTKKQYFQCLRTRARLAARREACIKATHVRKRSRWLAWRALVSEPPAALQTPTSNRGPPMTERAQPTDLELAALISSKICHDVIGPVGAIYNGLEILDEDDDAAGQELRPRRHPQRHRAGLRAPAVRPLRVRRRRIGRCPDRSRHRRADQPRPARPGQAQAGLARHARPDGQGQGQAAAQPRSPAPSRRCRAAARSSVAIERQPGAPELPAALPRSRRAPAAISRRLRRPAGSRRRSMPCRSRPITRGGWRPPRACGSRSPRTAPTSA